MPFDKNLFLNPELKHRIKPMIHSFWPKGDPAALIKALKTFGYGGAVLNATLNDENFISDADADEFAKVTSLFKAAGMDYWIYDEKGYPSGNAGGLTLKGHPEFEAKGMYMVRRIAYEPRHTTFTIDDETDKIVWAAKYPLEIVNVSRSYVQHDKMIPVPFTDTFVECDLNENEAFFVFCVKPAYEGTHCTHNVCSHRRYINIMNKDAVKRFIDIAFEGLANRHPEVYENAEAVFTDEPSLMTHYTAPYETWPYAIVPWVDGLFEEYETNYGESILPYLPLLFEDTDKAYSVRVKFYRLVSDLIASAYSGQISEWCRAHKTKFSGHYLSEEWIKSQVESYGDNVPVIKAADFPGLDILQCNPERYNCNTAKYIQVAARKKGTKGMMVELCPYSDKPLFSEDPWNNMTAIVGLLALSGVRKFHSYFRVDFSKFDERIILNGYDSKCENGLPTTDNECVKLNEYVGRLSYMLDGLMNDCNTFVYRAVEDAQARTIPTHTASVTAPNSATDNATGAIAKAGLFNHGIDFHFADYEDIIEAGETLKNGKPTISGIEVKTIVIPGIEVIDNRVISALLTLQNAGVKVLFHNRLPVLGTTNEPLVTDGFKTYTTDEITKLVKEDLDFIAECDNVMLVTGQFTKDDKEMYLVCNNTRGIDAHLTLNHKYKTSATLYNPEDGSITPAKVDDEYVIPSFRSMFVVFD